MDAFFRLEFATVRDEARDDIVFLCFVFLIIAASVQIGNIIEHGGFAVLAESMTARLRVDILKAIFRQEIGFHDDPENTPGMMSKALELWAFRVSTLCKSIGAKAAAMSSVLVGVIIAFVYCWQMALVMLGTVPIMIAANAVQMLVMLGASKVDNEGIKHAAQVVSDSVMNARTVQALGVEQSLVQMYTSLVGKSTKGASASLGSLVRRACLLVAYHRNLRSHRTTKLEQQTRCPRSLQFSLETPIPHPSTFNSEPQTLSRKLPKLRTQFLKPYKSLHQGMWTRNFLAGLGFGVASGVMFFVIAGGFYYASVLRHSGFRVWVSGIRAQIYRY